MAIQTTLENGAPSSNPYIDSLIWGGAWANDGNTPGTVTLTYTPVYADFSSEWSLSEFDALESAMATWEAVADIDFVYSNDPYQADLNYWLIPEAGLGNNAVLGWHEAPGFPIIDLANNSALDGVFNPTASVWSEENNLPGGYSFITLVHELGHGLGLAHPHDGGDAEDASTVSYTHLTLPTSP
jgi:serralysin